MSFAWSKEPPRSYIEKAIQTEEVVHSDISCTEAGQDTEVPAKIPSDVTVYSSSTHSATAYTIESPHDKHNRPTVKTLADPFPMISTECRPKPLGPSRLSSSSLHSHKQSQLPFSRPNTEPMSPAGKRIVSLPETSTSGILSDSNKPVRVASRTMRVVSLPELECSAGSPSTTSIKNSLSFDSSEFSLDTSYRSSRQGSIHMAVHVGPLSDMPQTPSPPSSPESISITDSHNYIPGSIRGPNAHQYNSGHTKDDEGWISWANSPPRPIPALHGPLSLPYARCPSGAEGTLIEGNTDLPRMIWGLDLGDPQSSHVRSLSNIAATPPEPLSNVPPPVTTDMGNPFRSSHRRLVETHIAIERQKSLSPPNNTHLATQTTEIKKKANMWEDTPIHIHDPSLNNLRAYDLPRSSAINSRHLSTRSNDGNHSNNPNLFLLPSPFPSMQAIQYLNPRIFIEPRAGSHIVSPSRMSAIDIAYKYHIEQQQSALPTPPSSSAPQWSPRFSQLEYPPPTTHISDYDFLNDQQEYSGPQLPSLRQEQNYFEDRGQCTFGKQGLGLGIVNNLASNTYAPLIPNPRSMRPSMVSPPLGSSVGSFVLPKPIGRPDFEHEASSNLASTRGAPMISPAARREHHQLNANLQSNISKRPMHRRLSSVAEEEEVVHAPNKQGFHRSVAPKTEPFGAHGMTFSPNDEPKSGITSTRRRFLQTRNRPNHTAHTPANPIHKTPNPLPRGTIAKPPSENQQRQDNKVRQNAGTLNKLPQEQAVSKKGRGRKKNGNTLALPPPSTTNNNRVGEWMTPVSDAREWL